jgi:hypothetical protein
MLEPDTALANTAGMDARLQPAAKSPAVQVGVLSTSKPSPLSKPSVSASPARAHRNTGSFSVDEEDQIRNLLRRLESQGGNRDAAMTELSRKLHRSADSVIARAQQLVARPLSLQSIRKRNATAEATQTKKKHKPTTPTTSKIAYYSDQENEYLLAQLLSALDGGISLNINSDFVAQIAVHLGRTTGAIAHKLTAMRTGLQPQHTLLSGAQPHSARVAASTKALSHAHSAEKEEHDREDHHGATHVAHGQPYTIQDMAMLRDACHRAVAEGSSMKSVAVRLAPGLGRTAEGVHKVLRDIAKESGLKLTAHPVSAHASTIPEREDATEPEVSQARAIESPGAGEKRNVGPAPTSAVTRSPGGHYAARLHDDDEASFTIATAEGGEGSSDDEFTIGSEDISEHSGRDDEAWR